MSGWNNEFEDYMFEEEEAFEEEEDFLNYLDCCTFDDEDDWRAHFFGNDENSEQFAARLNKEAEGAHIINPKKSRQLKNIINITKHCLDGSYTIELHDPNVKYNSLRVTFKGKTLTIKDPHLLWRMITTYSPMCNFYPHTDGEVTFDILVYNAFIKISD